MRSGLRSRTERRLRFGHRRSKTKAWNGNFGETSGNQRGEYNGGPRPGTGPRSQCLACHLNRCGNDYRQRHLSCACGDDAGGGLSRAGLSGVGRWRPAFFFWGADLCRVGLGASVCRGRVCVCARCLWTAARISLRLDLVSDREAGLHRDRDRRSRTRAGNVFGIQLSAADSNRLAITDTSWPSPQPY
jgi:hypothetical protein